MKLSFQEALDHPESAFSSPQAVIEDSSLSLQQKRELLERWEVDAIRLQESESEGFGGGERSRLDAVKRALDTLR